MSRPARMPRMTTTISTSTSVKAGRLAAGAAGAAGGAGRRARSVWIIGGVGSVGASTHAGPPPGSSAHPRDDSRARPPAFSGRAWSGMDLRVLTVEARFVSLASHEISARPGAGWPAHAGLPRQRGFAPPPRVGQVFDLPLCPRGTSVRGHEFADHAASRRSLSTIRGRTLPPPAAWQVEDLPYGDGGNPSGAMPRCRVTAPCQNHGTPDRAGQEEEGASVWRRPFSIACVTRPRAPAIELFRDGAVAFPHLKNVGEAGVLSMPARVRCA